MLKRLWISLKRDVKTNFSNGYLLITVVVALLYLAVVLFAVPEQLGSQARMYVYDATAEQAMANHIQASQQETVVLVDSKEALHSLLEEDNSGVGIALYPGDTLPVLELTFQSGQNDQVRQLMLASMEAELRALYGVPAADVSISARTLNASFTEPIPFNKSLVTILLYSDPAMIGLLFVAALYFVEKQQGTLTAYMVTPGRVWEYVLSKAVSLALLAILFTLILAPIAVGAGVNYWGLLTLIFLGSILSSLVGTLLGSFFTDIGQFFAPAVLVIVLFSLPGVAYYLPSFSPWWLRIHPTYSMLFGMKEALFPSGNPQIITTGLLTLLALDAVMLFVSSLALDRQFVRR